MNIQLSFPGASVKVLDKIMFDKKVALSLSQKLYGDNQFFSLCMSMP